MPSLKCYILRFKGKQLSCLKMSSVSFLFLLSQNVQNSGVKGRVRNSLDIFRGGYEISVSRFFFIRLQFFFFVSFFFLAHSICLSVSLSHSPSLSSSPQRILEYTGCIPYRDIRSQRGYLEYDTELPLRESQQF